MAGTDGNGRRTSTGRRLENAALETPPKNYASNSPLSLGSRACLACFSLHVMNAQAPHKPLAVMAG